MGLVEDVRRTLRRAAKTVQAVVRWRHLSFNEAPPIFGNAKPKSGSHLLLQILAGFTRIMPYAYVDAAPIRTITKDGRRREGREIVSDLRRIRPGVIGWGYLEPTPENVAWLCQPGRVNYFIYRDPRDMLVSQVFFATDMYDEHGMHAFYKSLPDFGARLNVAITGIEQDGLKMVSVSQRYATVFQWLDQPRVMCLRFEDLVNQRERTLEAMLTEVEKTGYRVLKSRAEAVAVLAAGIQPGKSRTFRAGQTGGWRQYFTKAHKALFVDVAGDLLVRLGYEKNNDW